jgi:hypothetical protein
MMTVSINQQCPFVATVLTNRQKSKAPQHTEVEVRYIKDGRFGPYAVAFIEASEDPVYLSLKNLGFVSEVSDERRAKIDAERAAWVASTSKPVTIGTNPDWESEKAVGFDWELESGEYGVRRTRLFFPRVTRAGKVLYDPVTGTVPKWLWEAKIKDLRQGERLGKRWGT